MDIEKKATTKNDSINKVDGTDKNYKNKNKNKNNTNNYIFNQKEIRKKTFEDRWVKFAFGPQGHTRSENLNLGIVNFSTNMTAINHRHDFEEALYVLNGDGKIIISGNVYGIEKGDFVYVPKKTDHQIVTEKRNIRIFFIFGGNIVIKH